MLVKICGLTCEEDAVAAIGAGADLVGFVFVPGTPRFVDPESAGWIRTLRGAARVGVFRGWPLGRILEVRRRLGLDRVQLHGGEPPAWALRLGPGTVRARRVDGPPDWSGLRREVAAGCLPLLDSGGGGTGRPFDWAVLAAAPAGVPFGLAGGLTPDNVALAVRRVRPFLVDVSSGVERAPGRKDPEKLQAFVAAAREAARLQ